MTIGLGAGDVQIWYRHTEASTNDALEAAAATLSVEECVRADRFHFPDDRRDYIVAHELLRRTLSRYADVLPNQWNFLPNEHDKPFISAPPPFLQFNLTHTRGLVACAVALNMHVGIDVERLDRVADVELLAARHLSDAEVAALGRAGNARALFFELWTLKEAFIKAVGVGLSQPLNSVSFSFDEAEPFVHFSAPAGFNASEWQFALYSPSPDTRLAVAVHSPTRGKIGWQAQEYDSGHSMTVPPVRTTGEVGQV